LLSRLLDRPRTNAAWVLIGKISSCLTLVRDISLIPIACISLAAFYTPVCFSSNFQFVPAPLPSEIQNLSFTVTHRDKLGAFWIGSQYGLYRWDGFSLTEYSTHASKDKWIPDSHITDIVEGKTGEILISTWNGHILSRDLHSTNYSELKIQISPRPSRIYWIHPGKNGLLWAGTSSGLLICNLSEKRCIEAQSLEHSKEPNSKVASFFVDEDGTIYAGNNQQILKIEESSQTISKLKIENHSLPKNFRITSLMGNDENRLLIGTDTGHIALLDKRSGLIQKTISTSRDGPSIITSFVEFQDTIVIGTDNGLFQSDSNLQFFSEISTDGGGVPNLDIFNLFLDHKHIWISTFYGMSILSKTHFTHFDMNNSIIQGTVLAFTEDNSKNLWVGTYKGLYKHSAEEDSLRRAGRGTEQINQKGLLDQRISTLNKLGDDILIGFFSGGPQVLNTTSTALGIYHEATLSHSGIVTMISETENELWIGTYDEGLIYSEKGKIRRLFDEGAVKERSIVSLTRLTNGNLLIFAPSQVYIFRRDTQDFLPMDFGYQANAKLNFRSATQLENGDILLNAGPSGLYTWSYPDQGSNTPRLKKFFPHNSFEQYTALEIVEDLNGDLWVPTWNGLLKLDIEGNIIGKFSQPDGMKADAVPTGAKLLASDGSIYFGSPNGYLKFHPDDIKIDQTPPKTFLSMIRFPEKTIINNQPPEKAAIVEVTYLDRFITFDFSITDFLDPHGNRFRYKLEGFDPDWLDNGNRNSATYTNLPPGNYTFRAQGANSAGIWDPAGIAIPLNVLPPPWLSWWAYCIYALVAALAAFIMHRAYRSYLIEKHAEALTQEIYEVSERAEEEISEQMEYQQEMLEAAYIHKRDMLELIDTVIDGNAQGAHSQGGNAKRLHALSLLEECILYNREEPVADMHKFTDTCTELFMERSSAPAESIITVNEISERLVPGYVASGLAIIIYEILENTFQHAFAADSPANYVNIKLRNDWEPKNSRDVFVLTIIDNGCGAPEDLLEDPAPESGAATISAVVKKFEGTITLKTSNGTAIEASLKGSLYSPIS
jgi:ligand-binding sensor domain-containing protein/two-component sensor histidine kinase